MEERNTGAVCCPKFDPTPWEGKELVWKDKPFITGTVPQFLHMPFPPSVGKVITSLWEQAKNAGAAPEMKDFICMSYDPSPWKAIFYLSVTKEVPGANNVKLSGNYVTKVFDGPFNMIPAWIKEMEEYLKGKGKTAKKYYFYMTTCPKCAKKYGHNYVVMLAEI